MKRVAREFPGLLAMLVATAIVASSASAAWHEPAWSFRRQATLASPVERISGEERVVCRFFGNAAMKPDGSDIRVVTGGGRPTRVSVISVGPGDTVEIAFDALRGVREYYIYFGNPNSPPPEASQNRGGLLLEMRAFSGGAVEQMREFPSAFEKSGAAIGRKTLAVAQLGMNPFGLQSQTISRLSGWLFSPANGEYRFAVAADDRGALFLDGKGVIFARHPTRDARFQDRVYLERGWHEFTLYHLNQSGEGVFGVFWQRPDMQRFEPVGRESFGLAAIADVGPLEETNHPLTADFEARQQAECFFGGNYSYRYRLAARTGASEVDGMKATWDFGDGQTSEGAEAEHVYLTRGIYSVTLTLTAGGQRDRQTIRLAVDRDFERSDRPATDEPGMHAKLVGGYDLGRLEPESLTWATLLFLRSGNRDATVAAATRLVSLIRHSDLDVVSGVLDEISNELPKQGRINGLAGVWQATPRESDLQPWVACELATLLTWWKGDLASGLAAIEPYRQRNERARRIYGYLLVLNRRVDEGRKVLEALPVMVNPAKQAAISGALARTTEFYITEQRWEDGEEAWEKWQMQFPLSFLEGHSVLLRVELLSLRKANVAAANVAEAFAAAVPDSPYAPRLLNKAAKLLEASDATKAESLRSLLKQRYPEDPLSQ